MIGIVSSSHPELDRLAGELCRRGVLDVFVRRYVNKGRLWEKILLSLPAAKQRYASTFGRRPLSPGLSADKVTDAGVLYDFLAALFSRSKLGSFSATASHFMAKQFASAIGQKGAELLANMDTVVGNYSVAEPAFKRVKARGGRTILNYPNAHHHYSRRLLAEEAEREPEFASTITTETSRLAPVLDRECELADTILVGSSFVHRSFIEAGLGAKHIVVIPYGSETSRFSPRDEPDSDSTFRVLFVGQLTQRKGISYLLRAYKIFHGAGTELMIAGRFIGTPAALNPYRDLFSYLGNLPHAQLPLLYRNADVFVLPTLLEGMPLVVLEAMASGLPIITTSHGPGDIVRDGVEGFIVPIRDSEAIADRLEHLRANPEMRAEMGRSARQRALEFTWKAYCEKAAAIVLRSGPDALRPGNVSSRQGALADARRPYNSAASPTLTTDSGTAAEAARLCGEATHP